MGWRSTKASMDAGTYEPNVDTGGSFAQGFASSFVPMLNNAVSSYADEQKEKRMLELKESLLRQRPRAASTSTASRTAAADAQEIYALAADLGVSPGRAAGLYYSHDKDSSQARDTYNEEARQGLYVGEVTPFSPVQDDVLPDPVEDTSQTDDLSATEPDPTVGEEVEVAAAPEAASVDGVDTAPSTLAGFAAEPEEKLAFEPFQVSSLGSVADDLSLLSTQEGEEGEEGAAVARVAANIEADLEVAEATGQTATVTYQDLQQSGATGQETRNILKAGTRLPQVYAVPDPAKITTLPEANAAMTVLDGRSNAIGGTDDFDEDVRPMLESLIRSLTELPDLGAMLQNNERDKLQEFYESGYQQFQNTADPAQLEMHRKRAGELLQQSNSMPAIPETVNELHAMQNRLGSGEFTGVPTEWMEALNTATRTAELRERYGVRLTPEHLFDPDRSLAELQGLQSAVSSVLGADSLVLSDITAAISTKTGNPTLVSIADITGDNYLAAAEDARMKGRPDYAEQIVNLGVRIAEAARANDPTYLAAASELSAVVTKFQSVSDEVNQQARSYIGAVESAYSLSRILEQNPDVLRVAGGALPATISGVVGEISALTILLGSSDATMDGDAALRSVEAYESRVNKAFGEGTLDEAARAYAMFQAQETRLAFQVARMQQGTGGVISNNDFDSALISIRASRNPNTWADSIRGLIIRDEVNVTSAIRDFSNLDNVEIAVEMQKRLGLGDIVSVATLEQRVMDAGLTEEYQWLKSGDPLIPTEAMQGTTPRIPKGASAFEALTNNRDAVDALVSNVGKLSGTEMLDTYLNVEAKRLNLTVDQLKELVAQEQAQ
jgi:hypothetical protein